MSLINQVLKDIDSRGGYAEQVDAKRSNHDFLHQSEHGRKSHVRTLFLTAVAGFSLAILLCAVLYVAWLRPSLITVKSESALTSKPVSSIIQTNGEKQISPSSNIAQLTDLEVQRQIDSVDIYLNMSSMPFVKVDLDKNHHKLFVTLFDAKGMSTGKTIDIPGLGAFVVKPEQDHNNLKLSIDLPFFAKLVKIDPIQDAGSTKIHLSLKHLEKLSASKEEALTIESAGKKPLFSLDQHAGVTRKNHENAQQANQQASQLPRVEDSYRQVISMIQTGKLAQATATIRQQIVSRGVDPKLVLVLMKLLVKQGKLKDAQFIGTSALASYPHNPELLTLQAQIHFQQGKDQQALGILSSWTPPIGRYPEYYGLMASIYLKQGEPMLAGAIYRRLVELRSKHVQWWVGFAVSMQALGQKNLASGAYKRALTLGFEDLRLRDFVVRQFAAVQ